MRAARPVTRPVQEAAGAVVGARLGRWALAGVATKAFTPCWQGRRRWGKRLVFWLVLAVGEYRVNLSGTALCCLYHRRSGRPKVRAMAVGLVLGMVLFGLAEHLAVTWPVFVGVGVALCVYVPWIWEGIGARPATKALRRCRPPGAVVIHTVASVEPGAGRRLLEDLAAEADQHGWTLALEADNEALAAYYAQFGFAPSGSAVIMPWGDRNVPMARYRKDPPR